MFNKKLSKLNKTGLICRLVLSVYLSFVSFVSLSEPFTPKSNEVVASWESSAYSSSKTLQSVREHLQLSQFPGQVNIHQSKARSILVYLADQQQHSSEYWYLFARSLQHQHDFDRALDALDKALKIDSNLPSAWLLKANIHMAQSDFAAAKKACAQLIGNIDLITVATCSLEVASYDGKLAQSYTLLSTLLERSKTTNYGIDEQLWQIQVIADMALRLGMLEQAGDWIDKGLKNRKLINMPLSFIALWSDIQRELEMHQNIRTELASILQQASFKDDALLVRLAMAEKASNTISKNMSEWQQLAARRIQLRLQRQDYYHAADIARYYIYVQTSPEEALKWAKINYQQAKLFDDEKLLIEARKLNGVNTKVEISYVSN